MEIYKTEMKLAKIIVKYCPIIIAIFYFLSSILSCLGIGIYWITPIYYISFLPFLCLYACSKLLKFCIWHRLPLYYSISIDIINAIDYYIVIPIASKWMLLLYMLITGCFVLYGAWLKERYNRYKNVDSVIKFNAK